MLVYYRQPVPTEFLEWYNLEPTCRAELEKKLITYMEGSFPDEFFEYNPVAIEVHLTVKLLKGVEDGINEEHPPSPSSPSEPDQTSAS